MKPAIVWLLLIVLTGCATSKTASHFIDAPTPEIRADKAVLYIYRDYAEPTAFAAYLTIDTAKAASLNQQGFTWVYLSPGEHNFRFGWPFIAGMPSVDFKKSLEAGKAYAFQMSGSVTMDSSNMYATSAIAPIDIDAARNRMKSCCRYVPSGYDEKKAAP
jgi:hypothetical protein